MSVQTNIHIGQRDRVVVRVADMTIHDTALIEIGVEPAERGYSATPSLMDKSLALFVRDDPTEIIERVIDPLIVNLQALRGDLLQRAAKREEAKP